ncbi:hypothetical protein FRB90_002163 [Tulasnella sp. 427]|nr:hypothetical protein FRB90_002163 [Tulasnella sp. 427]
MPSTSPHQLGNDPPISFPVNPAQIPGMPQSPALPSPDQGSGSLADAHPYSTNESMGPAAVKIHYSSPGPHTPGLLLDQLSEPKTDSSHLHQPVVPPAASDSSFVGAQPLPQPTPLDVDRFLSLQSDELPFERGDEIALLENPSTPVDSLPQIQVQVTTLIHATTNAAERLRNSGKLMSRRYSESSAHRPNGLRASHPGLLRASFSRTSVNRPQSGARSRSATYVGDDGASTPSRSGSRRSSIDLGSDGTPPLKPALAPKVEPWTPPISPTVEAIKAYASLPPSPRIGEDIQPEFRPVKANHELPPFSLWEYLREELLAADFDSHQELKWERVSNFLHIPLGVEKVLSFGFILCLDTFLYTFTILPIRATVATYRAVGNTFSRSRPPVPPAHKADILRMLLLVASIAILAPLTDASKIYHSIRGQDTIKLYVIFNALEITDRLLISIGQDILDCMFSRSTLLLLTNHAAPSAHSLRPLLFFSLSIFYTVAHALILIYQLTALNVAINAYDNALLTLLISNQFVEIKGSVFKKFEKDNLFQITCAALMLVSIAIRNLIELSSAELDLSSDASFGLPVAYKMFRFLSGRHVIATVLSPVLAVLASELLVDWLKHAFITKFNHIRPSVYERYIDVLCRDLTTSSWYGRRRPIRKHTYVDQSPVVARRLGFASMPLAVLSVIIGAQSISLLISTHFPDSPWATMPRNWNKEMLFTMDWEEAGKWAALGLLTWFCIVTIKLILGINLLAYASRRREGMEERRKEDEEINDFTRPAIGEGKDEIAYNKELKGLLSQARDDVPPTAEIGENPPNGTDPKVKADKPGGGGGGGGRKKVALEDLTRFTMVKRIW